MSSRADKFNRRLDYYSTLPRINRPLFDADYDDSILYKRGQLQNMINYIRDSTERQKLRLKRHNY
ncbi:MAG: hypothetical protein II937_14020 [Bacteroidales bacterium]|nr:hypothetical protein [Bacteroidales bacterium]